MRRLAGPCAATLVALGCGGDEAAESAVPSRGLDPPVAINADPPVSYPPDLFRRGVEGTVVVLLWVDAAGAVAAESTKIAEGSGYPALDSAVLAAVDSMRFAPARQNGTPVSTWFLQPVHFRQPQRAASGGDR